MPISSYWHHNQDMKVFPTDQLRGDRVGGRDASKNMFVFLLLANIGIHGAGSLDSFLETYFSEIMIKIYLLTS